MSDKYNPEVGEIWWFQTIKKHCLILSKEEPSSDYKSYKWVYRLLHLETGRLDTTMHGVMNAHGDGWFTKVA